MSSDSRLPRVTVFSRVGCHLCESVIETVRSVQRRRSLDVTVTDIDSDPDLLDRYWDAIPVVLVDGVEVARHRLEEATLLRALGAI